jgi:bacterioferritin
MPSDNRRVASGSPGQRGSSSSGGVSAADGKSIEHLNRILKNELTAINQYFLHSRMLAHWGVSELAKKEYEESIDEMKHADQLVQRILFVGGLPNLQDLDKLLIGETVEEVIACDLKFERKAIADLRNAITHAESVRDYGSRTLYESILKGEEDHIDYLQTQQRMIAAIGLSDYIQLQSQANAAYALKPPGD